MTGLLGKFRGYMHRKAFFAKIRAQIRKNSNAPYSINYLVGQWNVTLLLLSGGCAAFGFSIREMFIMQKDIHKLREESNNSLALLKSDTRDGLTALTSKMDVLSSELDTKIDTLGAKMDSKVDALGAKMDSKVDALHTKIHTLGAKMDSKVDALQAKIDSKMDVLGAKMDMFTQHKRHD